MSEIISKQIEQKKDEFYTLGGILEEKATYNLIIGGRGDGKTTAILDFLIRDYFENGNEAVYVRRRDEALKPAKRDLVFESVKSELDLITKYSRGAFNDLIFKSGGWKFIFRNEDGEIEAVDDRIFCYAVPLSTATQNNKSVSYPRVCNIFYEEFIDRSTYLPDEFITFMNLISTIIRQRENVKVFLAGNTVDKFCPYFDEFNIPEIRKMQPGQRIIKELNDEGVKIAVDFTYSVSKKSDKFFTFSNQKLDMIKSGAWESTKWEVIPADIKKEDIALLFHIDAYDHILDCRIIATDTDEFLAISNNYYKVIDKEAMIYSLENHQALNRFNSIFTRTNRAQALICRLINEGRLFFDSVDTAELFRAYVKASHLYRPMS